MKKTIAFSGMVRRLAGRLAFVGTWYARSEYQRAEALDIPMLLAFASASGQFYEPFTRIQVDQAAQPLANTVRGALASSPFSSALRQWAFRQADEGVPLQAATASNMAESSWSR